MKICNRCGKPYAVGKRCRCQTAYKRNYNKFGRDKRIKEFRASKAWGDTRAAVISRDGGLDLWLLYTTGEIRAGDSVHHIEPLNEAFDRRLDMDNLITLSEESHGRIEYLYKTNRREQLQAELQAAVANASELVRGARG